MTKQTVLVRGMWGLGDNIFQRPFIRAFADRFDLYLETPWPELYSDLPIKFVRGTRRLYTQMRNVERQATTTWSTLPPGAAQLQVAYGGDIAHGSIITSIERLLPLDGLPLKMDLPALPRCRVTSAKPIALFRPVTVRGEWRNEARNPKPEYLAELAEILRPTHTIIVVGSVAENQEWLVGDPPKGTWFLKGEFGLLDLLSLYCAADVVIGGVGWIVPAALATGQTTFVVLGGHGAHNAPERITDPRIDCSRLGFAMPERFCRCTSMLHNCDKTITNLAQQFQNFRDRVGLCSSASPAKASPGIPSSASASTT